MNDAMILIGSEQDRGQDSCEKD